MIHAIVYLGAWLACQAPQEKPTQATETQTVAELSPALRIEAGRLGSPPASPLFAALGKHEGDVSAAGLSKEQLGLVLEMDATARKTLRRWLGRNQPKGTPALTGEDLDKAKAFVIGHMEAIALERVLTPNHAADWHKLASKPVMPPREGRYTLIPELPPDDPPKETAESFALVILNLASTQDMWKRVGACSDVFELILDINQTRKWGVLPDLTGEQIDLAKRLNAIACDAHKQWLLQGIPGINFEHTRLANYSELPPTLAMISRLSEPGRRVRESVVSHAEEILLGAVLEPSQRTELKRRLWINRGVRALLDPELSGILRLAKWQRDMIRLKLEGRATFMSEARQARMSEALPLFDRLHATGHVMTAEERVQDQALGEISQRNFDQRMANFDAPIWDILSTAQSRTLAKTLRKPIPKKEDEKTKKKSSRAG